MKIITFYLLHATASLVASAGLFSTDPTHNKTYIIANDVRIPLNLVGSDVQDKEKYDQEKECFTWDDDCHSCVVANCKYDRQS